MTKDQIRELLLELGAPKGRVQDCVLIPEDVLERFAAAIRSATKEEDARICDEIYERLKKEESWVTDPSCSDAGAYECVNAILASK